MRRIALLSAVLLATLLLGSVPGRGAQQPAPPQQPPVQPPPIFRGGTNLVQVDAIVADANGQPIASLIAADFEVLDDGKPVPIDRVRFLGAKDYSGDRPGDS